MKRHFGYIVMAAFMAVSFLLGGCSDDTQLDRQPQKVIDFIETYFPGTGVSSGSATDDGYVVKLSSGVIIDFTSTYEWESVNGMGSTLPQMMLFDCLPPALYEYIQEMEAVDGVYKMERNNSEYIVELLDNQVVYDIDSGLITMPVTIRELQQYMNLTIFKENQ